MPDSFTLLAAPKTDFWRKPSTINSSNAPTHLVTLDSRSFHRARVTASARWERLYDQGGLFIVFPASESASASIISPGAGSLGTNTSLDGRFWLKTGIEFFHEQPNMSVVASREWSDWSLNPLNAPSADSSSPSASQTDASVSVTIELEREAVDAAAGTGSSLFVYVVHNGVRDEVPIREVTWAFEKEGEISLGVYAARPTALGEGDEKPLQVTFEGFEHA